MPQPISIGIGHVFATGPDVKSDRPFHVGGMRLTADNPPKAAQWLIDPERGIPLRAYEQSGVARSRVEGRATWDEVHDDEIVPFFRTVDILLVYGPLRQCAWFDDMVFRSKKEKPVVVDLHVLAQYFLPGQAFDLVEEVLALNGDAKPSEVTVPFPNLRTGSGGLQPRLPLLVNGLLALCKLTLTSMLEPLPNRTSLYTFLEAAMGGAGACKGKLREFKAALEMARDAHRLDWGGGLFTSLPAPSVGALPAKDDMLTLARGLLPTWQPQLTEASHKAASEDQGPPGHADGVEDANPVPPPSRPVRMENVSGIFEWLRSEHKGLVPRSQQIEFASFCAGAVNQSGMFAVEGGTGTGKTLGYLIPGLEYVRANPGRQFVVATATKNLQTQVMEAELPKLIRSKSPYADFKAALLKGRANYLCLDGLAATYASVFLGKGSLEDRLAWLHIYTVLAKTRGEFEGIPGGIRTRLRGIGEIVEEIRAQDNCGRDCKGKGACPYPRALAAARAAEVIVTNHHKLVLLPKGVIGAGAVCVVDEADRFGDSVRGALSAELSQRALIRFIHRCVGGRKRRGFATILKDQLDDDAPSTSGDAGHALERIDSGCRQLYKVIQGVVRVPQRRLYHSTFAFFADQRWQDLKPSSAAADLQEFVVQAEQHLRQIQAGWDALYKSDWLRGASASKSVRERVERMATDAGELASVAHEVARSYPSDEFVHVFEARPGDWRVARVPYEIGEQLDRLAKQFDAFVMTSATLYVEDALDFFCADLTLKDPLTDSKRVGSPFDYERQVYGAVAHYLPAFNYRADAAERVSRERLVGQAVAQLCVATHGRTLVLFTSNAELNAVYELCEPVLERFDIVPVVQSGSSLSEIELFRRVEHSVIFGVDRFWSGVDFPGPTLSQVIVVRAPNPPLGSPLIAHRHDLLGRAFWDNYYHRASRLKLRQGFGRLIRAESDTGTFVILDSRFGSDENIRSLADELPVDLDPFTSYQGSKGERGISHLVERSLKHLHLTPEFEGRDVDILSIVTDDDLGLTISAGNNGREIGAELAVP